MAQVQRKLDSEKLDSEPEPFIPGNEWLTLADFSQHSKDESWLQRVLPPVVALGILGALIYFAGLLTTLIVVCLIFVGLFALFWNADL